MDIVRSRHGTGEGQFSEADIEDFADWLDYEKPSSQELADAAKDLGITPESTEGDSKAMEIVKKNRSEIEKRLLTLPSRDLGEGEVSSDKYREMISRMSDSDLADYAERKGVLKNSPVKVYRHAPT